MLSESAKMKRAITNVTFKKLSSKPWCRGRVNTITISLIVLTTIATFVFLSNQLPPYFEETSFTLRGFAGLYIRKNPLNEVRSEVFKDFSWYADVERTSMNYTCLIGPSKSYVHFRYVFIVHSAAKNFALRKSIRQSWAKDIRKLNDSGVIFLLGHDPAIRANTLEEEARKFGDILQYSVEELYGSLTKKSILMLEWARENVHKSAFLVKADDDILLNVMNFRRTIDTISEVSRTFIAGKLLVGGQPDRDPKSKYFVRMKDYVDEKYPPYVAGCLYVITNNIVPKLLRVARRTTLTTMEDVFITGILAYKLRTPRVSLRGINTWEKVSACEMHNHIMRHFVTPEEMIEDYRVMKTTIRTCTSTWGFYNCNCILSVNEVMLE